MPAEAGTDAAKSVATPPVPSGAGLSKTALALLLFVVANCLLVNLALPRLPWQPQQITTFDYTRAFFQHGAHSDSWKPARTALHYTDEKRVKPLYQAVYFDNNVRFQYPPSSLLVFEMLRWIPTEPRLSNELLNGISWLAIWALAGVVARIFYCSRRRYLRGPAASRSGCASVRACREGIRCARRSWPATRP